MWSRDSAPWYAWTTVLLTPAINSAAAVLCGKEAERRVTAWGVALRRHKLATGSYPEHLADLKPEFAQGLGQPLDPFTGAPLVYRREGSGFIVYSVSRNLKDDAGRDDRKSKGAADDIAVEFKD